MFMIWVSIIVNILKSRDIWKHLSGVDRKNIVFCLFCFVCLFVFWLNLYQDHDRLVLKEGPTKKVRSLFKMASSNSR